MGLDVGFPQAAEGEDSRRAEEHERRRGGLGDGGGVNSAVVPHTVIGGTVDSCNRVAGQGEDVVYAQGIGRRVRRVTPIKTEIIKADFLNHAAAGVTHKSQRPIVKAVAVNAIQGSTCPSFDGRIRAIITIEGIVIDDG